MAFQFPAAPTLNQIFTPIAGVSYKWNGQAWAQFSSALLTRAEADALYINLAQKAAANGVASLDAGAQVPLAQLGNVPASVASATQTFLMADVLLNNTANYFDIINTGAIGAAGQKWKITAGMSLVENTTTPVQCLGRIWDGTNVYCETPVLISVASGTGAFLGLAAVVTLAGPTTFRLSAKNFSQTTGRVATTGTAGTPNKATWIIAERIS